MANRPSGPHTIGSILESAALYLREKGSSSPRLDAELLLAKVLGTDRVRLYIEFDRPLEPDEVAQFRELVRRRAAHEPVAYILGQAHFRRLTLAVSRDVLIPRPETEELVEVALEVLRRRPVRVEENPLEPVVADVGTGSGAIALSLASEAGIPVFATDISPSALEIAKYNAGKLGLDSLVRFIQCDLLAAFGDQTLNLIVSNPPYVARADFPLLSPDIRMYEPSVALDGGPDGLEVIGRLVPEAARVLRPGGVLLMEIDESQARRVTELAYSCGFAFVTVHRDLSQKERIIEAVMPGAPILSLDDLDDRFLKELREALAAGAIIGIPTDTVYGIAARWDSREGVERLFVAKGRSASAPVAVLFCSVEQVIANLPDIDEKAVRVLRALLPGPYTFVVATKTPRPPLVGTEDSLGVRVPDYPAVLGLIDRLGIPLAATSANPSGQADVRRAEEVDRSVLAHCSVALDLPRQGGGFGETESARSDAANVLTSRAVPSTVVDLRPLTEGGAPKILRQGAVPAAVVTELIARALA
ncbi:MAG: peptide chain release factor N(5)-glutamine methyltransferase [Thermoleophilia bacterium]|nr:peptide chain release factor N(5)-glutamine methyltransferase [Thermoleophilia bacterium]